MTISAPSANGCCSTGVQKQLSTANMAPLSWQSCANAAISTSSANGLDGDSTNTSLVFSLKADSHAAKSVSGT